jgi:hypothetical protein
MVIPDNWHSTLLISYEQPNYYLVVYVPQLIGVLLLILLGRVTAWAFSKYQ